MNSFIANALRSCVFGSLTLWCKEKSNWGAIRQAAPFVSVRGQLLLYPLLFSGMEELVDFISAFHAINVGMFVG